MTFERDILKTFSTIDFEIKLEIWYQTTGNTDAIDFGPSAKNKMATIELFIRKTGRIMECPVRLSVHLPGEEVS